MGGKDRGKGPSGCRDAVRVERGGEKAMGGRMEETM